MFPCTSCYADNVTCIKLNNGAYFLTFTLFRAVSPSLSTLTEYYHHYQLIYTRAHMHKQVCIRPPLHAHTHEHAQTLFWSCTYAPGRRLAQYSMGVKKERTLNPRIQIPSLPYMFSV